MGNVATVKYGEVHATPFAIPAEWSAEPIQLPQNAVATASTFSTAR